MTADQSDRPMQGILLVLSSMLVFAGMDGISKALAQTYHLFEISLGRYVFTTLFLLPAILRLGPVRVMRSTRAPLLLVRGVCMLGSAWFFILALRWLPLADATAISFLSPLLVTALSIPLLGERVGARRWTAVAVGFAGILIIVRPGAAAFDPAALLPIGSAFCWALGLVLTRMMHRSEAPLTIVSYTALVGLAVSAVLAPPVWVWPDLTGWVLMAGMGLCSAAGQYLLALGYIRAGASLLAPFSYSQMVWASLIGYFVFASIPDSWTLAGAAVVMASGLYVLQRERKLARQGRES